MRLLHSQTPHFQRHLITHHHHSTLTSNNKNPTTIISNLLLSLPSSTTTPSSLSSLLSSFPPLSSSTINSILKRLRNDAPRSLLFFRSLLLLPSSSPSLSSFNLILDITARLPHPPSLHSLPFSPRTFSILAERFCSSSQPDRAIRLFLSLPHPSLPLFNSLLDALSKSRRVRKASSLFRSLSPRFGSDPISFNILAHGWCRLNRTNTALHVVNQMLHAGLLPTLPTYNTLLNGFFREGRLKDAWRFFLHMKNSAASGCCPDVVSYTTVVHGLGIAGQTVKARRVFDGMIADGCLPSVPTYNALMQVVCKKEGVRNALLLFDEMLSKGYAPNATSYTVVIKGLCIAGEMGRAVEFMERMRREGCEPVVQTYNVVIRHWCEAGEVEKGLEMIEGMRNEGSCLPNVDTYNVVIGRMFARRRSEDMVVAGRMVMEMVESGFLPRRFMFKKVLNGLLLTGNQDFARELLRMQDRFGRLRREIRI